MAERKNDDDKKKRGKLHVPQAVGDDDLLDLSPAEIAKGPTKAKPTRIPGLGKPPGPGYVPGWIPMRDVPTDVLLSTFTTPVGTPVPSPAPSPARFEPAPSPARSFEAARDAAYRVAFDRVAASPVPSPRPSPAPSPRTSPVPFEPRESAYAVRMDTGTSPIPGQRPLFPPPRADYDRQRYLELKADRERYEARKEKDRIAKKLKRDREKAARLGITVEQLHEQEARPRAMEAPEPRSAPQPGTAAPVSKVMRDLLGQPMRSAPPPARGRPLSRPPVPPIPTFDDEPVVPPVVVAPPPPAVGHTIRVPVPTIMQEKRATYAQQAKEEDAGIISASTLASYKARLNKVIALCWQGARPPVDSESSWPFPDAVYMINSLFRHLADLKATYESSWENYLSVPVKIGRWMLANHPDLLTKETVDQVDALAKELMQGSNQRHGVREEGVRSSEQEEQQAVIWQYTPEQWCARISRWTFLQEQLLLWLIFGGYPEYVLRNNVYENLYWPGTDEEMDEKRNYFIIHMSGGKVTSAVIHVNSDKSQKGRQVALPHHTVVKIFHADDTGGFLVYPPHVMKYRKDTKVFADYEHFNALYTEAMKHLTGAPVTNPVVRQYIITYWYQQHPGATLSQKKEFATRCGHDVQTAASYVIPRKIPTPLDPVKSFHLENLRYDIHHPRPPSPPAARAAKPAEPPVQRGRWNAPQANERKVDWDDEGITVRAWPAAQPGAADEPSVKRRKWGDKQENEKKIVWDEEDF